MTEKRLNKENYALAKDIKKAIVDLNWRQKTLVHKSGISQSRISKISNAHVYPSKTEASALLNIPELAPYIPYLSKYVSDEIIDEAPVYTGDNCIAISTIQVSPSRITCLAISPDDNLIYASGFDGRLYRICLDNPNSIATEISRSVVRSICYSVYLEGIVAGADDGQITFCDDNTPYTTYPLTATDSPVYSIININNGNRFITAERNGCVTEWLCVKKNHPENQHAFVKVRVIEKHMGASFSIDYSEGTLISVGADGVLFTKKLDQPSANNRSQVADCAIFCVKTFEEHSASILGCADGNIILIEDRTSLLTQSLHKFYWNRRSSSLIDRRQIMQ